MASSEENKQLLLLKSNNSVNTFPFSFFSLIFFSPSFHVVTTEVCFSCPLGFFFCVFVFFLFSLLLLLLFLFFDTIFSLSLFCFVLFSFLSVSFSFFGYPMMTTVFLFVSFFSFCICFVLFLLFLAFFFFGFCFVLFCFSVQFPYANNPFHSHRSRITLQEESCEPRLLSFNFPTTLASSDEPFLP